jgi:ATP-dependent Zn protease
LSIASTSADYDSDKDKEYIPKNKSNNMTYDNNSDEEIIIAKSTENNDSNIVENHINKGMFMFHLSIIIFIFVFTFMYIYFFFFGSNYKLSFLSIFS